MKDDWQPAQIAEVQSRLAAESRSFEPIDRSQWSQVCVTPFQAKIRRSEEFGDESVFVVARDGSAVIFFDDAEDEFGGATLDQNGNLKASASFGELKFALRRFRQRSAR